MGSRGAGRGEKVGQEGVGSRVKGGGHGEGRGREMGGIVGEVGGGEKRFGVSKTRSQQQRGCETVKMVDV